MAAAICVSIGTVWGIQMSISGDHNLSPAHAYLNLVGWVTLGLFGLHYSVTPRAADSGLARIHLAVARIGVVLMFPGIAMAIRETGEAVVAIGSMFTVASTLIFLFSVFRNGLGAANSWIETKQQGRPVPPFPLTSLHLQR